MSVAVDQPVAVDELTGPPAHLRFKRKVRLSTAIRDIWRAREVIRALAERDYRVRYKQAILGISWAILTPLALMVVFTFFFQRVAHLAHGNAPYALFAYMGLVPWTFFSNSLSVGGLSLVSNVTVLNKVYCPREVFPIETMIVAAIDTVMSLVGLTALFVIYQRAPSATIVYLPIIVVLQVMITLAVTLLASIIVIYLRDLRNALPILVQMGLFASPVAYGLNTVPAHFRNLYVTINPMAVVIDGYRRTVLFDQAPQWGLLLRGSVSAAVLLTISYAIFKKLETGIADVA
jgi:ABC-type polysaccharide/polyol phosphate export permease